MDDLSLVDLPEIELVGTDVNATLNQILQIHSAITGRTLAPADPEKVFLHTLCAIIVQQRVLINLASKQNLLRYASADVLDHLGAMLRTTRLPAHAARTTLRFQLSALQLSAIPIPAGTRVSTKLDPKRYFRTLAYAEISAGSMTVDVEAECTELGVLGNGFVAGQVNLIVDPIAFIASATNTTTTSGGADAEGDDAFRARIHAAPESLSVAGPVGAYRYWAMTASPLIVDVSVTSPAPVQVKVVPLLQNGGIPDTAILDAVEEICLQKRPLTDQVTVEAPTTTAYNVELTYWINRDDSADASAIQLAVVQAVDDFITWQKSKLGRDINPSELIRRVMDAGAYRVDIVAPVQTTVNETAVAIGTVQSLTYGGIVDD